MNFSQRMNLEPVTQPFQLTGMNDDVRTGLWNAAHSFVFYRFRQASFSTSLSGFVRTLWTQFFNWPIDKLPSFPPDAHQGIRNWYFNVKTPWNKLYELMEFLGKSEFPGAAADDFRQDCNHVLTRFWSGYRFIGGVLAPVTDQSEIDAIQKAASLDKSVLAPVSMHISKAVELLSDKTAPDFSNSMKESISAVEAICKIIAKNANLPKPTLGPALDVVTAKVALHPKLQEGFKALFGYTNDTHGIRHAYKDDQNPEPEDAKFMLVTCSAFVNYLAEKARKAGLL